MVQKKWYNIMLPLLPFYAHALSEYFLFICTKKYVHRRTKKSVDTLDTWVFSFYKKLYYTITLYHIYVDKNQIFHFTDQENMSSVTVTR